MKRKRNEENSGMLRPVLKGTAVGSVIAFLLMLACAAVLAARDLPESAAAPMATVAAGIGAFCGGFAAAKSNGRNGLASGASVGGIMFIVLVIVAVIVSGSDLTAQTPLRLAVMLLASSAGGVLGVGAASKRKMI